MITVAREQVGSEYMAWAKTSSQARFNLATSGLANVRLAEMTVRLEDLELTRDGGYGYEPLQNALAARLGVGPESIVTAIGTSLANHLAMAALINPGDEVLIEQPTYEPLLALARYLGADIKRFKRRFENDFKVLAEEVERNVSPRTRLIVLTNLQNPTGVLIDEETLRTVGQLARLNEAHVLIDEVYLEALFAQRPATAFKFGPEFVTTSSLTKAFGLSGLRCGWIVSAPEVAQKIWQINDLFGVMPAHPAERLSVIALEQLERISANAEARLRQNRAVVYNFLDTRKDLEAVRPEFGTIVFPRLKQGSVDDLCRLLKEKYETSVVPGRFFEAPGHFRLGFGNDPEMLREGLTRLGAALDEQ
ncbi:MAG TPA: pyridoxal phosphate-dependent aminotransferase [Pyrinomonadaceae bacterium]|nr:pyridoxal phosphate-dependent aminotransferase [Pyrinomonadaceae bacterium]